MEDLLVWLDMEMSGLDPERDRILEVAVILTNGNLEVVAEGPHFIINQSDAVLAGMDEWNTEHHGASGLIDKVRASTMTEAKAESELIQFLEAYCAPKMSPLAGNSVHQDRRFLARYMPKIDKYLHYRIVDVSSIKELCRRWYPETMRDRTTKKAAHRAMDDVLESIEELRFYRSNFFRS